MALLDNIKRAFGFGPDDSDLLEDSMPYPQADVSGQPEGASMPIEKVEVPAHSVQSIFDTVLSVFNASLPDFLSRSVDPDKQKKLLFESLDASVREYLLSLEGRVQAKCEAEWSKERAKLQAEAAELRNKAAELEEKRAELNDRQLSADRQKRALADRVHDLEAQVLKLEAEKEQLDIENKCMINKAKAAAVLEAEIEDLRNLAAGNADSQLVAKLRDEAEQMRKEKDALKAACDEQAAVAQKLQAACDEKEAIANALGEELATLKTANDELANNAKDMAEQIEHLMLEIKDKEEKLIDIDNTASEIEAIQKEIEKFSLVKAKMDERIEKLRASLKTAQAENESLRQTIAANLLQHAEDQKALADKIAELEKQLAARPQPVPSDKADEGFANNADSLDFDVTAPGDGSREQRKRRHAQDAEDELMMESDWLVASPADEKASKKLDSADTFGYQPPQKKPKMLDNDAQMSLFDGF